MTKLMDIAAERKFLNKINDELFDGRRLRNHGWIVEAIEDLELVVQHSEVPLFRERAQRLIQTAFDPLEE